MMSFLLSLDRDMRAEAMNNHPFRDKAAWLPRHAV
jgi:hypothetical protein